jgi:leucyl aminopeptidase
MLRNTSTSVIQLQQIHYGMCGNATVNAAMKFLVKLQQQLTAVNIIQGAVNQLPIYHHYSIMS